MVPSRGIIEKEYWSYNLEEEALVAITGVWKDPTYVLRTGLLTLLNSRHENVPPGLRTRYASRKTAGIEVQFRIPNAMV